MKKLIKPAALKKGDTVATISLSWGGATVIPSRYEQGKRQFEETFGVKIIATPNSTKSADELYENPQLRLDDLMWAFQNKEVKAILTNIGGSDTIRLLPLMTEEHFNIIRNNPKIFLGMSDTTTNHLMCFKAGLSSFYSPSMMYGFAENGGVPDYTRNSTLKTLFEKEPIGEIAQNPDGFIVNQLKWGEEDHIPRIKEPNMPWQFIQGKGTVSGPLFGGCLDVFSTMIFGTYLWPSKDELKGCVLFLETSEDMPPPDHVLYVLRGFGAQGILEHLAGILYARPGGEFTKDQQIEKAAYLAKYAEYDEILLKVSKEFGRPDLPIITRMDFGHTVPQLILPYGCTCRMDMDHQRIFIDDNAVV